MANRTHVALLLQGEHAWNAWRQQNPSIKPDLSGITLPLVDSTLVGLDLTAANLRGSLITETALPQAILRDADLLAAHLFDVDLTGADLSNALMGWTRLNAVVLRQTTGLQTVRHEAASSIGVDTLCRSRGDIPGTFLRGAFVPDIVISLFQLVMGQPRPYVSCFISYSRKDRSFTERLYKDLCAKHVHCWYFPESAEWGEPVWGEIDRGIQAQDRLIVVCSRESLQSQPVLREIERALGREDRDRRNILFPVAIDDYLIADWQHPRRADVLSKVVGEFQHWDRGAHQYDQALSRLLKALEPPEPLPQRTNFGFTEKEEAELFEQLRRLIEERSESS